MWRFYSSILTLFLILCACFSTATWIQSTTLDYIHILEEAQSLAQEGEWKQASIRTQEVYDHWTEQSFRMYITLRHSDLDKIKLCFQSVSQYLEQEDQEPYMANNAQLITQLELLAEMEQCTIENIL